MSNPTTNRRVMELAGCSYEEAAKRMDTWQFHAYTTAQYCVRWPQADRTFSLPITYLAAFGDNEECCRRWIEAGFSGDAKREVVPWLTPYGVARLAQQLTGDDVWVHSNYRRRILRP